MWFVCVCVEFSHTGLCSHFQRQWPDEPVLISNLNTLSNDTESEKISVGIKLHYHEILTSVVDLTQWLSTLRIWKISNLKAGGTHFMFVPITLVMRCVWVCSNDSDEKDKMTTFKKRKNRAAVSMTCQTELSAWCMLGQKECKIHNPQQQGQIKENTGLARSSPWLLKYIWITILIITLTREEALLYECYLRSIS